MDSPFGIPTPLRPSGELRPTNGEPSPEDFHRRQPNPQTLPAGSAMADVDVPPTDSTRTTILGYVKYGLTALMWLAGILGIDVTASGVPILPDAGEKWYVYLVVGVIAVGRVVVGMLQSKSMADAKAS